jgi:hypothetical protein
MKKKEYSKMLGEALVTLLISGPDSQDSRRLYSVLKKEHPERENAFVEWALEQEELESEQQDLFNQAVELREGI